MALVTKKAQSMTEQTLNDTITNIANVRRIDSNEVLLNKVKLTIEKFQNGTMEDLVVIQGDTIEYKIIISNLSNKDFNNAPFTDQLDSQLEYVDGSFKVDGVTQIPAITNNKLFYLIPNISANGSVTIELQVSVL